VPDTTLAEQLRAYLDADKALASALEALDNTAAATWGDDKRACYLSGHDDAKAESAEEIAVLREEGKRLTARVRELEANNRDLLSTKVIVCDDHEVHEQPAAVGVVGAVLGYTNLYEGNRFGGWYTTAQDAKKGSLTGAPRVVAIVDPAQIVPLASGKVARWVNDEDNDVTVIPLYPGIAQLAQVGE
jgi:hypothetical protein